MICYKYFYHVPGTQVLVPARRIDNGTFLTTSRRGIQGSTGMYWCKYRSMEYSCSLSLLWRSVGKHRHIVVVTSLRQSAYHVLFTATSLYANPSLFQLRRFPALSKNQYTHNDSWQSPAPTRDQGLANKLRSKLGKEHDD